MGLVPMGLYRGILVTPDGDIKIKMPDARRYPGIYINI